MKPFLGLTALLTLSGAQPASAEPWSLPRSDVEQVTAPDGHAYRLMIAWPEGEPPETGWPVLWVLDGEDNFAVAVLTARRLARAGARSGVGEGIIAAIDSGPLRRRIRDYTPAVDGYAIPKGHPGAGFPLGGADAFLDLIEGPMRQTVAARWRVDPERNVLMGHSFGGLLPLHALFTGRGYSGVVAVSPSLWYGGDALRKAEAASGHSSTALLIASNPGDSGPDAASGAAAEALVERLHRRGRNARYLPLPGQSHGSTMLASMTAAISFAFAGDLP